MRVPLSVGALREGLYEWNGRVRNESGRGNGGVEVREEIQVMEMCVKGVGKTFGVP